MVTLGAVPSTRKTMLVEPASDAVAVTTCDPLASPVGVNGAV